MEKEEIKLELIKVCFRHDRHPGAVVEVAKILEQYVLGSQPKQGPKPSGK